MKPFKVGDHVWVHAGYSKPREAVIMKIYQQSADVYFVRTQTYCCVPFETLRPIAAFAIMGDNDDNV